MSTVHEICDIYDIQVKEENGFLIETNSSVLEFFIVRKNNQFHGYINRRPHTSVNLNWQPNQFLNPDSNLTQCSTHSGLVIDTVFMGRMQA